MENKKFLLLYGVYSDIDYDLYIDCLGMYNSYEAACNAMALSQEEDEEDGAQRQYRIKEVNV